MFKTKLKKNDMDLGDMINSFIMSTELEEAMASSETFRGVYRANKILGRDGYNGELPEQRDTNYAKMAKEYRDFLMLVSAYMLQDEHDQFKDFMEKTDKHDQMAIIREHYNRLPVQYYD